jgi:hypothetical protein
MSYEINVSKNGKHYFATAKRSIDTLNQAVEIRDALKKVFPPEEGFEFNLYSCQETRIEIQN